MSDLWIIVGAAVEPGLALLIGLAIVIDNVAEALSIGELIRAQGDQGGGEARRILGWTGLIGVAVFASALVGWYFLQGLPRGALGALLAAGAGGMLYLTVTDLVPKAETRQYQQSAALALGCCRSCWRRQCGGATAPAGRSSVGGHAGRGAHLRRESQRCGRASAVRPTAGFPHPQHAPRALTPPHEGEGDRTAQAARLHQQGEGRGGLRGGGLLLGTGSIACGSISSSGGLCGPRRSEVQPAANHIERKFRPKKTA